MAQEVSYLVKNSLAIPSSSPWSSPCLLVPLVRDEARFAKRILASPTYCLCVRDLRICYSRYISAVLCDGVWDAECAGHLPEIVIILADVPHCAAYLDDVVVYSNDWAAHVLTLTTVFQRLARASLTLNLAKCEFGRATVTYLG